MDSLDAQCLIIDLIALEMPPPQLWRHDRSGRLSCAFAKGGRSFTWDPDAVAEMARRWRESASSEVPEKARPYLDAHRRLEEMVNEGGLERADEIVHDFDRHEVRARWAERKVVMVIDEIGEPAAAHGS